jgi:O-antigen/teichoic acid export membrane protein
MASIFGGLSMEASIAVAESQSRAARRALGTSLIGIVGGSLFLALTVLARPYISHYYSESIANALLLMLPLAVPLTVIETSTRNYLGYLGRFNLFMIADILSPILNYSVLFAVYFMGWKDYRCLVVGFVVGLAAKITVYLFRLRGERRLWDDARLALIWGEMWRARSFSKLYLPANIVNTANTQLPTALLGLVFPEGVVGLFVMARTIITLPTTLSGKALGQVFYPKAANEFRQGRGLSEITWRTFLYSCQLVLFPALFTAAAAGLILPLLLGPKWVGVSPFVALLLPMVLINAVQTQIGVGFVFSILNQLHKVLTGNLLLFSCTVLPVVICLVAGLSPHGVVFAYSLGGAVGYALLLGWVFLSVSISIRMALFTWLKYCLLSGLCISPVLLPTFFTGIRRSSILVLTFFCLPLLIYGVVGWTRILDGNQRAAVISAIWSWIPALKRNELKM